MSNQHLDKRDPITPLSPKRQERILQMTMKKINGTQPEAPDRSRRPLHLIAATAGIAALLCATTFAASELKLFDFSTLFGERASLIEEAITTYTPASEEAISAFDGRTEENFTATDDYNFLLLGDVEAGSTLLRATFDVSTVREDIPDFTTTGLQLELVGYETRFFSRDMQPGTQRITIYALLEAPLSDDTAVSILVTDGTSSQPILDSVSITSLNANTAVFSEPNPDADYVLDTAALTENSLTVTGHFQKTFEDYAEALDASGAMGIGGDGDIHWPLKDKFMDTYDPDDGAVHEDLEGYLVVRNVSEDGGFTLEWTFIKGVPPEAGMRFQFGGEIYTLSVTEQSETEPEAYTPNLAISAETQDYRFTLESITASSNAIYAVMDMEPLTAYGRAHMDLSPQELTIVCGNFTHTSSGSGGSALIESTGNMSRYLVYRVGEGLDINQVGDIINFQIHNIIEDGNTAEHGYDLFDVELETIISTSAQCVSETASAPVNYTTVSVTPISLYLEGQFSGNENQDGLVPADYMAENPEIILGFRDGSSYTVMDQDWRYDPAHADFGEYGIITQSTSSSGDAYSGTIYRSLLFSQIIPLEELSTITINGTIYQVNYVNE